MSTEKRLHLEYTNDKICVPYSNASLVIDLKATCYKSVPAFGKDLRCTAVGVVILFLFWEMLKGTKANNLYYLIEINKFEVTIKIYNLFLIFIKKIYQLLVS